MLLFLTISLFVLTLLHPSRCWTLDFISRHTGDVTEKLWQEQRDELIQIFHRRFQSKRSIESFILFSYNNSFVDPADAELVQRLVHVVEWAGGPYAINCITAPQRMIEQAYAALPYAAVPDKYLPDFSLTFPSAERKQQHSEATEGQRNYALRMFLFDTLEQPMLGEQVHPDYFKMPLDLRLLLDERHEVKVTFHLPAEVPYPIELRWAHFRGNTRLVELGDGTAYNSPGNDNALVLQPGESVVQYTRGGHLFTAMLIYPFKSASPTSQSSTGTAADGVHPRAGESRGGAGMKYSNECPHCSYEDYDVLGGDYDDYLSELSDEEYETYLAEVYRELDYLEKVYADEDYVDDMWRGATGARRGGYFGDDGSANSAGTAAETAFGGVGDDYDCDCMTEGLGVVDGDPYGEDLTIHGSGDGVSEYANRKFHDQLEFDRVLGLYMVPSIFSEEAIERGSGLPNFDITIDPFKRQVFNVEALLQESSECRKIPVGNSADNSEVSMTCFRHALLTYWEKQRLSQVKVNSWAVPRLPLASERSRSATETKSKADNPYDIHAGGDIDAESETNTTDVSTAALYTVFSLPKELQQQLKHAHINARGGSSAKDEPPISQVFNQHKVSTRYVPLPNEQLDAVTDAVLQHAATWLGRSVESLYVTGAYGSREYGSNAIIRWHVDPVESQPITAIIHVAHDINEEFIAETCAAALAAEGNETQSDGTCDIFGESNECNAQDDVEHNIGNCFAGRNTSWPFFVPSFLENYSPNMPLDECDAIYLQEGDVLLLQSAKLPHSRLLPLQTSNWYANAFVHIAPSGWDLRSRVQLLI